MHILWNGSGGELVKTYHVPGTNISLLTATSKLDYPGWAIPAKTTCQPGKCHTYCYGAKGRFTFLNVKRAQLARYEWSKKCELYEAGFPWSRQNWIERMCRAIKPFSKFRIHVVGDFYSEAYCTMWWNVIERLPDTHFWIPTRAYKNPDLLPLLRIIAASPNATVRPSADPGEDPPKIEGLHAGTTIENHNDGITQCYANTSASHTCEGCTICWDEPKTEISYRKK